LVEKALKEGRDYLKRFAWWKISTVLLFLAVLGTIIFSTAIGPVKIPFSHVFQVIVRELPYLGGLVKGSPPSDVERIIVLHARLPRVLGAGLVGAALAVAGVVLQGLLRNPMADPFVIGISSGAGLGAALAIGFGMGTTVLGVLYAVPITAFLGALVTVFAVYNIAKTGTRIPMLTLLLAGIAVSSFLSAIISFVMITAGESLHALIFWLLGGFSTTNWNHLKIAFPPIVFGILIIYIFARDLNIMLLGEEQAQQLGVEAEKLKKIMLVFASLITATAVSFSGIIGFVGLIIPHITRILVGADHRFLIPASALTGMIVLILSDTAARTVIQPTELPVGVITALFGGPFFLYLLRKRKTVVGWHGG
jgi:iron complex transport system permease protein